MTCRKHLPLFIYLDCSLLLYLDCSTRAFIHNFDSVYQSSGETIVNCELNAGRGRRGAAQSVDTFCGLMFFPLSSLPPSLCLLFLSPLIAILSLTVTFYSVFNLTLILSPSLFQHVSRAAITLRLGTACPGRAQAVHCLLPAQTLVKQCSNDVAATDQQTVGAIPCAGQRLHGLLGHLEATQPA